jgi:ABC-type dipeptide/oligopeptide/nickel transport system permease subunit
MTTATTTTGALTTATIEQKSASHSLWADAWRRLIKDRAAVLSLIIVVIYALVAICATLGIFLPDWQPRVGTEYLPPSMEHWLGTDLFGRNVLAKVIHGTKVAMSVGLVTALIAIPIGVFIGAIAGYFGGWVDDLITWFITTFSSIPNIMLLISMTLIMGKGLTSVYLALGLTSWVSLARLIRGEVMKHKEREYVQAAAALGASDFRKLFIHILPNVTHIIIINTGLQFQTAIKSEVILSYLGLGVQGQPSWGTMIDDARVELARGVWWQLAGATFAMFIVVLAFNILGDSLRDALDPKLKGRS